MSYTNVFHDYISDIPMDMSRKFYPTQNISLDVIHLPDRLVLSRFEYPFSAETRAREQFDKQEEPKIQKKEQKEQKPVKKSQKIAEMLSQDVLVPVSVNSAPNLAPITPNPISLPHSLHEFESIDNVFDEIQIRALDDKKALQEILMSTATPPSSSSSIMNNNNHLISQNITRNQENGEKLSKDREELKGRLLTKGYRSDIVEIAIWKLPKNRLTHIEYYMKACRTVEKTGHCSIDDMLPFLISSNISDKKIILDYSESVAALLKMGFVREQVFEAVGAEQGDKTRALNRILMA